MQETGPGRIIRALGRNVAFQDVCCVAFHAYMSLRVLLAPDGPDASAARPEALALLLITSSVVLLVRGEVLRPGVARALLYRVGMVAPMVLSYLALRHLLPALRPQLLDAAFLRLDERIFGVTPARWLARFASPPVVEWFAFFYYSYFALLSLHILGSLFLDRGRRMSELLLGAMLVTGVGHTLYTLFPGAGPWVALRFDAPLQGHLFFRLVMKAVTSAGAMLDIFPSLHTAHPTLFFLHTLRHRREAPFRYTLLPMGVFAANIIIATLLLRWHYGVDVLAGLALAAAAQQVAIRVSRREAERPGQPVWEPLWPRRAA